MPELQRQQREFMNAVWQPPEWIDRSTLTPMADYAWFSSLIFCRQRLPKTLGNYSLLLVNCGWGADTHFFQTEGASRLTVTDLSERAIAMTRQHCPGVTPVLSATEELPFADDSFDFVGVRSGLHHLQDPYRGLAEMARVARYGFFFIEGQATPLTPLLVRLGFLEDVEEGGNEVFRFTRTEVASQLAHLGIAHYWLDTRWFMQLPPLMHLSRRIPGRLPGQALRGLVRAFNSVLGRLGNAMVLVGVKRPWTGS